jgi:hypothetical protein
MTAMISSYVITAIWAGLVGMWVSGYLRDRAIRTAARSELPLEVLGREYWVVERYDADKGQRVAHYTALEDTLTDARDRAQARAYESRWRR